MTTTEIERRILIKEQLIELQQGDIRELKAALLVMRDREEREEIEELVKKIKGLEAKEDVQD